MHNSGSIRESQFELIRIIAMFFIVMHHLIVNGADTVGLVEKYTFNQNGVIGALLNSFLVGGANLFVLISGWFGIRNVPKGVLRLIIDCFLYGIISYVLTILLFKNRLDVVEMAKCTTVIQNWFVIAYLILLLLIPIVESSLKYVSYTVLTRWIIILTIVNVGFGYLLGSVNVNGYNYVNVVYLYYIGRWLRMGKEKSLLSVINSYGLLLYIGCSLSLFGGYLLFIDSMHISYIRWFSYNNPIVLLASIFLFSWLCHLKFVSRWINYIATCVFGVFILHTTSIMRSYLYPYTADVFSDYGYPGLFVEGILIYVSLIALSFYINKISKPAVNFFYSKIDSFKLLG